MNASEFNTEIHKVITRGVNEGIAGKKMSFETMIGVLQCQQQQLFDWRAAMMAQAAQAAAEQPPIILPGMNGFTPPPRG